MMIPTDYNTGNLAVGEPPATYIGRSRYGFTLLKTSGPFTTLKGTFELRACENFNALSTLSQRSADAL